MKKLLLLLLAICFVGTASAQKGVKFEQGTLAEVLAKAKQNKKGSQLIFVDCYTTWCGPCKKMMAEVFPQEKVGNFFKANFVCTKIDMEKGEGPVLKEKYNVRAYPTFLILDSNGNELNRILGGGDADEFIAKVQFAMKPENSPTLLKALYEKNKNMETGLAYLKAIKSDAVAYNEVVRELYSTQEDKNKLTPEFVSIVLGQVTTLKDPLLTDLCINKIKLDSYLGSSIATQMLKDTYWRLLYTIAVTGKTNDEISDIENASKLLGVLITDKNDPLIYIGPIALLIYQVEIDQFITYFRKNIFYLPQSSYKLRLERIFHKIGMNGNDDQKASVHSYFSGMANSFKFNHESYSKMAERLK